MNKIEFSKRQLEIIQAAIELLNEKGYNELTLRDIAKKLGVKAPAIYWHFKNKALLIDYIAEYLLQQTLRDIRPRKGNELWQNWLRTHILLLRKAMLSCGDGGRIVAGAHLYPAITLASLMENALASLRSAGLDLVQSRTIIMTSIHYTFGHVIEEQAGSETFDIDAPRDDFTPSAFPNLFELTDPTVTKKTLADKNEFLAGLQLIIAGVQH